MNADAPLLGLAECVQFMRFWIDVTEVPHVTLIAIAPDLPIIVARTFARGDLRCGEPVDCRTTDCRAGTSTSSRTRQRLVATTSRRRTTWWRPFVAFRRRRPVGQAVSASGRAEPPRPVGGFSGVRDPDAAPTAIIDSGNGIQVLWAVTREMLSPETVLRVEAETRAIEAALGAGGTHNIDRLLRLPGTVNYPNRKKKSLGRGISRTQLISLCARPLTPRIRRRHWRRT